MRSPSECDAIQIDVTNACVLRCSGCTRFCGHHTKPFFMSMDDFRAAIDSLVEFAALTKGIVGVMGGEPTLAPLFEEYCRYAASKIPREKLGLWSVFPPAKAHLAGIICETFGNILLNDHSRNDIMHAPVLMAAEEFFTKPCGRCKGTGKQDHENLWPPNGTFEGWDVRTCGECGGKGTVTDDLSLFQSVEHCWVQEHWSASIHPKGAYFCEVAAALSETFNGPDGWKVEPGWWKRTPKDFHDQVDWACRKCGAALPLNRKASVDVADDVSPKNLERLREMKSRKVARGEFVQIEKFGFDQRLIDNTYPNQTYQETEYRKGIAARYGIHLVMNSRGYWEPRLGPDTSVPKPPSMFKILSESYA